jgi:hypothetical protein
MVRDLQEAKCYQVVKAFASKDSAIEVAEQASVVPYFARSRAVVRSASHAAGRVTYNHLVRAGRWKGR